MTHHPEFHSLSQVHCIGVGGAGMSGIARLLRARGLQVTGSDAVRTDLTDRLVTEGIAVDHGQTGSSIDHTTDLVIASAAIRDDNAEMVRAREHNVPVIKYADAIGAIMRERVGIAVAGTHGKTTTSSMLAWIFAAAGREPSFLIGGEPHNLGTNARHGNGPHLIVEACEYDRSFHRFDPTVGLITNIDADHLDYYGSIENIRDAFIGFARGLAIDGLLIANADDPRCREVMDAARHVDVRSFSLDSRDSMWRGELTEAGTGRTVFSLKRFNWPVIDIELRIPGLQNIANACAAIAAADWFGIEMDEIAGALSEFTGVGRRFHQLGEFAGVPVVDDYAHHPVEIEATLRGARLHWPERELWVVFQPHQAFRTKAFFDEFADALANADRVFMLDIYAAREGARNPLNQQLSQMLADAIRERGIETTYCEHMGDVISEVRELVQPDVALMTIGAGNVHEVAEALVRVA